MKAVKPVRHHNYVATYGLAVTAPIVAAGLTAGIIPDFHTPFFDLFQAAVVVAAWYGGFGPGALSGLLSVLIIDWFYVPPVNQFTLGPTAYVRLLIFLLVGIGTSFLSGKLRRSNADLESAQNESEANVAELQRAKTELERIQEHLEFRTEERTRELVQANDDLKKEISKRIETERAMIDITSREQRRLGQDLHDGLCQILTGVKFMTQGLRQSLEEREIAESKRMLIIENQLGEALTFVDTVSRGLYPVELDVNGLAAALKELAEKTSKVYGVDCKFKSWSYLSITDGAVANHLYRIAQEAVINAIKSGKASRIHIRLFQRANRIVLSVADNGVGLSSKPVRRGMGRRMMEYRAHMINGSISLRSRKRGVTLMTCAFEGAASR